MHNHVNFAVAVYVFKLGGHRDLRRVVANNDRAVIDAGMRHLAARQLDDDDSAFHVGKNKMRRMIGTVVMTDHCIGLVGAGKPVSGVELMRTPPGSKHLHPCPEQEAGEHTDTDKDQPVLPRLWRWFGMENNAAVALLDGIRLADRIAYGAPGHTERIAIVGKVFIIGRRQGGSDWLTAGTLNIPVLGGLLFQWTPPHSLRYIGKHPKALLLTNVNYKWQSCQGYGNVLRSSSGVAYTTPKHGRRGALPDYLRVQDIVDRMKVSEETVRIWIRQKKLPAIRIGRDYFIDPADFQEFLKRHRTDRQDDTKE